ncbi:MAG: long-chain fatty acid--CoA ligase [Acidobacteria bacterium]|nr:long-chain fatty acid--CoA ligase [Candidatus Sulfomarinibacter sp. MAG AM1]
MSDRTILDLYRHELDDPRDDHYVHYFPGGTRSFGTMEFFRRTVALADALADLGVAAGDRVIVVCDTRPEWHMVDIAILSLGAVNAPIYATLTPEQVAYQAGDSGAAVAIAENPEQMAKFIAARPTCPELEHLVQMEGPREEGVFALDDLWGETTDGAEERFWERANQVNEEDLATIVYTSGTTGEPKGVMLTHRNIVTNVIEGRERVEVARDELGLEFLPLCHMIERLGGYIYMSLGVSRAYCSVYHVGELMKEIRPAVFASVPRLLEKVHAAIVARAEAASTAKRALFHWAVATGAEVARRRLDERPVGAGLALRHRLADRLVLAKIRAALGGKLKASFCGGAAVPLYVHEFFQAIGIPIQEAWGLTETSPLITMNGPAPGDMRLGSVGRPLPSYEMRVADDGELLAKGPSVFTGYWNKPEQTAEVFDAEGFFRTGDIGTIDDDGFIFITDRKKDLIVTAGGKNIAPQPVESELKKSPYIENAVLIGDNRPCIVALLAPDPEVVGAWAGEHGMDADDLARVVAHPDLAREFARAVESANAKLARFEQIKTFRVLPEPLTVEGGALTPTMKVKRRAVTEAYADLIDEMYAD